MPQLSIPARGPRPSHAQKLELLTRAFGGSKSSLFDAGGTSSSSNHSPPSPGELRPGCLAPDRRQPAHHDTAGDDDNQYWYVPVEHARRLSTGGGRAAAATAPTSSSQPPPTSPPQRRKSSADCIYVEANFSASRRRSALASNVAPPLFEEQFRHQHHPTAATSSSGRRRSSSIIILRAEGSRLRRSSVEGGENSYAIPLDGTPGNSFRRSSSMSVLSPSPSSPLPPPRPSLMIPPPLLPLPASPDSPTATRTSTAVAIPTTPGDETAAATARATLAIPRGSGGANRPLPPTPNMLLRSKSDTPMSSRSTPPALPQRSRTANRVSRINLLDLSAMTESERIAVMRSVSDGQLTVDGAASRVKAISKQMMGIANDNDNAASAAASTTSG